MCFNDAEISNVNVVFCLTEEGGGDPVLLKGESVVVVGASARRGHLLVDHQGHTYHVPFQYMELKPSGQPGVNI